MGLGVGLALLPTAALAHAQLLRYFIPEGSNSVALIFNEPVTPVGPGVRVYAPSGGQVAFRVERQGNLLVAFLHREELGTYVVVWQVLAADTHPSRGAFSYDIDHASKNPYSWLLNNGQAGTTTGLGLGLQTAARWLHFIGFALAFGVIAYRLLTGSADARLRRLVGGGVFLLVVAEPVAFVAQLASLSFDADTAVAILGAGFGRLLGIRLAAALLLWALLAIDSPWPALALGLVVALVDGATAHAISGLPGAAVLLDGVHVAAMGVWAGGLAAYLIAPHSRFTRIALVALSVALGSGLLLAFAHLGRPAALIATDYGRVLVVKAALLAGAVVAARYQSHRHELRLVALTLVAAGLLVSLPPPR